MRPPAQVCRLLFFGSPALAVAPLRAVHEAGYEVVLAVTQPPRRRARRGEPVPTAVASAADELGIPVAVSMKDPRVPEAVEQADLGVVVAYGELIGSELLQAVPMVNLHFSLLPRWRGAAPVERAVLAGDAETGVCVMQVVPELDAGGVYRRVATPIGANETAAELSDRLTELGVELLIDTLAQGLGEPIPQAPLSEVTYARKITSAHRQIDWSQPAVQVHRTVRIGDAHTKFRGRRLKVLRAGLTPGGDPAAGVSPEAHQPAPGTVLGADTQGVTVATGEGGVRLLEVQAEGKAATSAKAWFNGARIEPGERLGQ